MSIIITGREGFIAKKIKQLPKVSPNKIKFTAQIPWKRDLYLDLSKPQNFSYNQIQKSDFVVHLAAISSPDECEKNYEFARKINLIGTEYFLKKCLERGAKVLFFSSDTVYGATTGDEIFDENSETHPIGKYAEMKREIEKTFLDSPNFKVFRLSYVFSKDDKFTSYLARCSAEGAEAEIFHPIFRNVVYSQDVLDAISALAKNFENFEPKIVNLCGKKILSRKDLAGMYRKIVDKNLKMKISRPPEDYYKARPEKIAVHSLYFEKLLARKPTDIEKAMKIEFNK